jgi:hypothetical protein
MKEIIITAARIKIELRTLLICFSIGFIANIGAIIFYKTVWTEILTSIPYIFIFTLVLYGLYTIIRIILFLVKKALSKRHSQS